MKSVAIVLVLSVFCISSAAQKTGDEAVVSAVYMNVLYRGVSNPVAVAVPGVKSERITLTVSGGSVTKGESVWEVKPGEGPECTFTVSVDGKKFSEKVFRVKSIPSPLAVFAGKYEGSISKETAINTGSIEAVLIDFLWDLKFTIDGFVFATSKDGMDYEIKSEKGNKLTDEMKSMIASTPEGKYIVFKNITAINPDGRRREMNDIVLQIVK